MIDDPRAAEVSLHPVRSRLLAELADGGTASGLAAKLGLTRQKANYHLRELEAHGLVELVEERRTRNTTERVLRAAASSYVISPAALPTVAPRPGSRTRSSRCTPASPEARKDQQASPEGRERAKGAIAMSREFECKREVVLPASPEEVWDAVATAAGNAAWLFPNEIAPDGSGASAWDPPHHFAARTEQGDWFNALEYEIESQDGSRTTLRYAHSGIFMENWDTQYDAVQQHTDFYLHTLGQYLQYFNGRPATYIGGGPGGLQAPAASATPDGFRRLQKALGLTPAIAEGDAVTLTAEGMDPLDAVIDYKQPNFLSARTSDGLYCFFGRNAFGAPVGMSIHLFGEILDADAITEIWQNWLNTVLA